nr:lysophospholipid acyltransferase family protein [uncultured Solibaculum sp.]
MSAYMWAVPVARPLLRFLFRMKFYGFENIPKEGGVLLCCNHRTYFDPVALAIGCNKRVIHYMAKEELFHGLFGKLIKAIGAFPVNRQHAGADTMNTAYQLLKDGEILGMFPEGTRSKDGKLLKFKAGAVMIAAKENVPILPAAVCFGKKLRPFCRVSVRFGKPVMPADLGMVNGTGAEMRAATRQLMDKVDELLEMGV